MLDRQTVPVTIEFRLGSAPIAGSLRIDHGPLNEFCGWLQLTSLLDGASCTPGGSARDDHHDRRAT